MKSDKKVSSACLAFQGDREESDHGGEKFFVELF